ncbi:tRNA (adenosine(37)-N6)-threonylcarbamoyltransferase complex ATPase subunit type 1 TsaE [Helicobacter sp. 13S00477-4]|uniref:tRNA (adenosine(37)-N6)-threonylcarbamoyltransferase complex ATPase subunit type 1 TsaE n=1 Tax=Helicobacter sp. 13S00477-4 TaxID=1905759 RepID=UPI000BA518E7|nr:tRNA (adenosine(37)-N6)-threonylcarbamoyltransferase complex ATPase subunit type 1 TsaE [Helicobacter sp. 13S00477-4]PAF50621.1 tRNA (adenosine(37)-N6)-threonylcarbamoyltransferase complex ATPase subunit type 1 TsaE [Helicobacter sp. 13S00477-4]
MVEICADINTLDKIILHLKKHNSSKIFLLQGDLASGKTTLVQAYTKSIYPNELVTSPTFNLIHQYKDIYHYDFYQRPLEELLNLGLLEWFENNGVHFVEWGDKKLEILLKENGYNVCIIELIKQDNHRIYRIF